MCALTFFLISLANASDGNDVVRRAAEPVIGLIQQLRPQNVLTPIHPLRRIQGRPFHHQGLQAINAPSAHNRKQQELKAVSHGKEQSPDPKGWTCVSVPVSIAMSQDPHRIVSSPPIRSRHREPVADQKQICRLDGARVLLAPQNARFHTTWLASKASVRLVGRALAQTRSHVPSSICSCQPRLRAAVRTAESWSQDATAPVERDNGAA